MFDESVAGISSLVGALLLITTITVFMRAVARRMQETNFGIDGWLMIPAWLCFVGICIVAIYGMANNLIGVPEPSDKATLAAVISTFIKLYWVSDILSIATLGFVRLSAVFFLRRIFVTNTRGSIFNIVTIIYLVVITLWTLAFLLFAVFMCGGATQNLFTLAIDTSCSALPFLEGVAISSFILDVFVILLPVPMIWNLQASLLRKIGITLVFLTAAAGIAGSCARMVINIKSVLAGPSQKRGDPFLANTQLLYYLILEAGLVLIAINLPSLWYFVSGGHRTESLIRSVRSMASLRSTQSTVVPPQQVRVDDSESTKSGVEATPRYKLEFQRHEDREPPIPAAVNRNVGTAL